MPILCFTHCRPDQLHHDVVTCHRFCSILTGIKYHARIYTVDGHNVCNIYIYIRAYPSRVFRSFVEVQSIPDRLL